MIFLPHLTDLKKLSALLWDCLIICTLVGLKSMVQVIS